MDDYCSDIGIIGIGFIYRYIDTDIEVIDRDKWREEGFELGRRAK